MQIKAKTRSKGSFPGGSGTITERGYAIGDLKIRSHEPAKHLHSENGLLISGNNDTTIIVMPADIS